KVSKLHGEPGQQMAVRAPLIEFEVEGAGNSDEAPLPLEGGGAGGGGGGTPPQNMAHEASSPSGPSAPASQQPATTPTQPSPLEGEASTGVAPGANYVFKLPDVGEGTAEAELVGWHVAVGDAVAEDQIL